MANDLMAKGEHCKTPVKHIAIGVAPMGTVAVGIVPMGVISIGVVPMGVVSIGVVAMGVINLSIVGMGLLAIGANTMGVWTVGPMSMGLVQIGGRGSHDHNGYNHSSPNHNSNSLAESEDDPRFLAFPTKAEAEAQAKLIGCEGVHQMGSHWMACSEHSTGHH